MLGSKEFLYVALKPNFILFPRPETGGKRKPVIPDDASLRTRIIYGRTCGEPFTEIRYFVANFHFGFKNICFSQRLA